MLDKKLLDKLATETEKQFNAGGVNRYYKKTYNTLHKKRVLNISDTFINETLLQ